MLKKKKKVHTLFCRHPFSPTESRHAMESIISKVNIEKKKKKVTSLYLILRGN